MLANKYRGDVTHEIDGRLVTFRVDMGALGALMTAFETDFNTEVMARLMGRPIIHTREDGTAVQTFQGPSLADFPIIASALCGGAVSVQRFAQMSPPEGQAVLAVIAHAVVQAMDPGSPDAEKKSDAALTATAASH